MSESLTSRDDTTTKRLAQVYAARNRVEQGYAIPVYAATPEVDTTDAEASHFSRFSAYLGGKAVNKTQEHHQRQAAEIGTLATTLLSAGALEVKSQADGLPAINAPEVVWLPEAELSELAPVPQNVTRPELALAA